MASSILILDYSTSRIAVPTISEWMPKNAAVQSLFIDSEVSFPEDLLDRGFTHVIHSGSELSITEFSPFGQRAESFIKRASESGISQMGICYGHQLICKALLGPPSVRASPKGFEAGWITSDFNECGVHEIGLRQSERLWQHHFDEVVLLPEGSNVIASNDHCEIQAYINPKLSLFGMQFHPEVKRRIGNKIFQKDRALLLEYGYDINKIIAEGPSPNAGRLIFDYFLRQNESN